MPRILETTACPHCKADLPQPAPRTCPNCAGSIQKRYLTAGCLSSAPPPLVLLAFGLGWLFGGESEPDLAVFPPGVAGDQATRRAPPAFPGAMPGAASHAGSRISEPRAGASLHR